ncbi:MAG: glycosyltransferase family 39 protein, partial [Leadbetterella sp.]|nr:glycosyltransferase family 39 protein [Leadbetterella sp.]
MKIGGINHVAYRVPSLLFLAIAAFCTHGLARRLYGNNRLAHLAALIFLSAQTILLSAHDVRTDAILTGAVALGICYTVSFIRSGRVGDALLGGAGIGMAFGSKGMVGVGIVALCVLCYLLYSREWKGFFRKRAWIGLGAFVITIFPVLYAYYNQFDLHPEPAGAGGNRVS